MQKDLEHKYLMLNLALNKIRDLVFNNEEPDIDVIHDLCWKAIRDYGIKKGL